MVYQAVKTRLLTSKYLKGIPADSRAAKPTGALGAEQVTEDVVNRVQKLSELAAERGQNLALAWVLTGDKVTSA
jgi:L-glyceraldehyde 3-phosphate reductase